MRKLQVVAMALLLSGAVSARATDLLEVWQAVRAHDPQGQVLDASRAVALARRDQAAALWRPSVVATAAAGVGSSNSSIRGGSFSAPGFGQSSGADFATSIEGGSTSRWSVGLRQPLYDRGRDAQQLQLMASAQSSEFDSHAGVQDWMLQTAQRYFEVILAERRLELAQRQLVAVGHALAEARDRYALGDAPVTDTHEALARQRSLVAQVRALGNDSALARAALADSAGWPESRLRPHSPRPDVTSSLPPLDTWVLRAVGRNPRLLAQRARVEVASLEARRQATDRSATVELVAQTMQDRVSGRGDFGSASASQRQQMVGVTLQIPLYSGGMSQARETEALRHEDRERAVLATLQMQVTQQVRAAWFGLVAGQERLAALADARVASQSRLDATHLGRKVGDRTTLELLAAESDADAADLALLQARVDQIMGELRLHSLVGELDLDAFARVDARLER